MYQAGNEIHKWLQPATLESVLGCHPKRGFSGLSEFLFMVGDIYMSSNKLRASEANSVLLHMRKCLIQARSLLPVRASCFWIAFSTAGLLLDCFQLRSLAFGLLSALPACFWIAFSTCGLDWIWIVSLIGNLRKDCSRKLEVFPLRTEPRGHVFLAVHMQATRLCTITPQQSWPPRIVAPR